MQVSCQDGRPVEQGLSLIFYDLPKGWPWLEDMERTNLEASPIALRRWPLLGYVDSRRGVSVKTPHI